MKNYIRGIFFCAMWYLSIIAGFFILICPILPLVIISPKKYRRWSDRIFGLWEPFPVAMMEVCFGIRVVLSGDKINPFEGSLFIMNHRTRVDWNFLWLGLFHCCQPNAHNMKYILKAPIMHFPGPGWVMQTCSFIFVHRNWARDRPLLNNIIEYLNESDNLYQILMFPEGTDLTEKSIKKSHQYAEENNLQKYSRVLHPRTTGFTFLARKMMLGGQLKAIYDVTIAYPKTMPTTELDLLRGKFPEEVHLNVKRHSASKLPCDEEYLKTWLTTVWQEKEEKLQRFYATGCFTGEGPVYNLADQDLDFRRMSVKDGVIKQGRAGSKSSVTKELSIISRRAESLQKSLSSPRETEEESSEEQARDNEDVSPQGTSPGRGSVTEQVELETNENPDSATASTSQVVKPPSDMEGKSLTSTSEVIKPVSDMEGKPLASTSQVVKPPSDVEGKPLTSTSRVVKPASKTGGKPLSSTESETYTQNHINCEDVYRSKNYRPSHLLYLVLVFWITLIAITIHQLCYNFYLQLWVLTHSVFFICLSFLSNGFHHVAASIYFYKYKRDPWLHRKIE